MDEVIVIVLLATLFAICFGAVEIYIRLNDDKKTIWLWTAVTDILSGGLGISDFVSKS